MVEGFGGGIW
jgi:hypothetical protein